MTRVWEILHGPGIYTWSRPLRPKVRSRVRIHTHADFTVLKTRNILCDSAGTISFSFFFFSHHNPTIVYNQDCKQVFFRCY